MLNLVNCSKTSCCDFFPSELIWVTHLIIIVPQISMALAKLQSLAFPAYYLHSFVWKNEWLTHKYFDFQFVEIMGYAVTFQLIRKFNPLSLYNPIVFVTTQKKHRKCGTYETKLPCKYFCFFCNIFAVTNLVKRIMSMPHFDLFDFVFFLIWYN